MDVNPTPSSPDPAPDFLRDVFGHLPLLIVQLTVDGIVLSVNEQTCAVTGYQAEELVGRNWWGQMFPGKLFRQVPKFISTAAPAGVLRDVPMVLKTADEKERTIAWTRFLRTAASGRQEIVVIGLDLTDRLLQSDVETAAAAGAEVPDAVDGSFIEPLAASPPKLADDHGSRAIEEVHDFLTQMDTRIRDLERALTAQQYGEIVTLAESLHTGARACGLLHLCDATHRVSSAAAHGSIIDITKQVQALVDTCRQPLTNR